MRAMLTSVGLAGHVFPVLALARQLRARGHEVLVETSERWRDTVEGMEMRFAPAHGIPRRAGNGAGAAPTLAHAARSLLPTLREFRPDVIVSDLFTLAPALAAEAAGVPRASLIHHPYPVSEPTRPSFPLGFLPPRQPLAAGAWRAVRPLLDLRLRRGRRELNEARAALGLPGARRFYGSISEGLALVATFPQLEYPRRWPAHVHVTGPMIFELPHPEIELLEGAEPLVVVAASSAQDPELTLVRIALEALQDEPVRVVATTSGTGAAREERAPDNAMVLDWVSYAQVMPRASLVVCSGGHGTVARALADGVPLLVSPAGADQPENGARVTWAGAGLMLPGRLLGPRPLRWAVRRLLADRRFTDRAAQIAAWSRRNDGTARGAELVERLASR